MININLVNIGKLLGRDVYIDVNTVHQSQRDAFTENAAEIMRRALRTLDFNGMSSPLLIVAENAQEFEGALQYLGTNNKTSAKFIRTAEDLHGHKDCYIFIYQASGWALDADVREYIKTHNIRQVDAGAAKELVDIWEASK